MLCRLLQKILAQPLRLTVSALHLMLDSHEVCWLQMLAAFCLIVADHSWLQQYLLLVVLQRLRLFFSSSSSWTQGLHQLRQPIVSAAVMLDLTFWRDHGHLGA